eukprot:g4496.t1
MAFLRRAGARLLFEFEVEKKDMLVVKDKFLGPLQLLLILGALAYVSAFQIFLSKGYVLGAAPLMNVQGLARWPPPGKAATLPPIESTGYCQGIPWTGHVRWQQEPADYRNSSDCVVMADNDVDLIRVDEHGMLFVPTFVNEFTETLHCMDPAGASSGGSNGGYCQREEWHWESVRHSYVLAPEKLQVALHHTVSAKALSRQWDVPGTDRTSAILRSSRGPLSQGTLSFNNASEPTDPADLASLALPNGCGVSSDPCSAADGAFTEDVVLLSDLLRSSPDAFYYFFKNGQGGAGDAYTFDAAAGQAPSGREQGLKLRLYISFSNLEASSGIPLWDRVAYTMETELVSYGAMRSEVHWVSATERKRFQRFGVLIEVTPAGELYEFSLPTLLINLSVGASLVSSVFVLVGVVWRKKSDLDRRCRQRRRKKQAQLGRQGQEGQQGRQAPQGQDGNRRDDHLMLELSKRPPVKKSSRRHGSYGSLEDGKTGGGGGGGGRSFADSQTTDGDGSLAITLSGLDLIRDAHGRIEGDNLDDDDDDDRSSILDDEDEE